ncbi:MAG: hypothetical protein LBI05_03265 [Planctomycetaceae bacterium]|nr:hypothetical protein [Planctomycetaceae bacterium]
MRWRSVLILKEKTARRRLPSQLGMLKQIKGGKTMANVKYRCAVDPDFRTTVMKKFLMR